MRLIESAKSPTAWAALAVIVTSAVTLVAISAPLTWIIGGLVLAVLWPWGLRSIFRAGGGLSPWKVFLPALASYTAVALLLERPASVEQQIILLLLFCTLYSVGYLLLGSFLSERTGETVAPLVDPRLLVALQLLGTAIYLAVYAQVGIPLLSGDPGALRVELASPGRAGIFIFGRACVQLALIIDLLLLMGRVKLSHGRRASWLHAASALVILATSTGRSDLLAPVLIGLLAAIYLGWRRPWLLTILAAIGISAFLMIGTYRSQAAASSPVFAQAENYLVGTAQTNDRILRVFADSDDRPAGDVFLWWPHRLVGETVTPPGIFLRDEFDRTGTFVGFGLETNIIGALYIDWGARGVGVGAALFGAMSQLAAKSRRSLDGWGALLTAYVTAWLLQSVAVHPFASYASILFPLLILGWILSNNSLTRRRRARVDDLSGLAGPKSRQLR